jgi:drug/metabolite transporter (DMT)-like permease
MFAVVSCLVLLTITGDIKHWRKAFNPWVTLRTLCEVVAVIFFIIALARVPLADVTAIYQIAPLIVLAGASFLWGEQVGLLRWLLIALGLAGALLVAQPGSEGASPYALLCFVTALGSAARDLFSRKVTADIPALVNTLNVVVLVMLAGFIGNALFETWVPVRTETWGYGLGAGFFVVLGHLFVFLAFRWATARAVAPFYYGLTVFAVIFGLLFFGEWPNTVAWGGIALIIFCGLSVLAFERREKNKEVPA